MGGECSRCGATTSLEVRGRHGSRAKFLNDSLGAFLRRSPSCRGGEEHRLDAEGAEDGRPGRPREASFQTECSESKRKLPSASGAMTGDATPE
jgi:hypothetical protein